MTLTAVLPQSGPNVNSGATPSVLVLNKLVGLVVARRHPHRRHYQMRTADGIHVTVHDPTHPGDARALAIGQQLSLRISPHAVLISPPRPIEPTEDNVWPARVVLPADQSRSALLIVKIIGQPWTLTSMQPEGQGTRPLRAWDRVTVRIRPEACVIDRRYPHDSRLHPRLLTELSPTPTDSRHTPPDRRPPYPALKGREPLSCVPCPPAPEAYCDRASRDVDHHHSRRERSRP
ncbi:MAG: hypothetical protein LZF60_260040 [Nitrospira sp.]|nr:hypothetical protein [Nitrospira sp.]ULA60645.1 MAG: hypothetical protein LZF60_260040 [Nitrospira sp.]